GGHGRRAAPAGAHPPLVRRGRPAGPAAARRRADRGAPRREQLPLTQRRGAGDAPAPRGRTTEGPTMRSALRRSCAAQLLGRLPWLAAPLLRALRLRPRLLIGVSRSRSVRTRPEAGFIAPSVPPPEPAP